MIRLAGVLLLAIAAIAALAVQSGAGATDAACRKWEVKLFPMKAEEENALRAGKAAGPHGLEEGWEPFGMAYLAVAGRRCAAEH
jgi:hypothetical protein